jgi:hypothetical protein
MKNNFNSSQKKKIGLRTYRVSAKAHLTLPSSLDEIIIGSL